MQWVYNRRFKKGMEMKKVSFTKDELKKFITTYKQAVRLKLDSFMFKENKYVTNYAKYLIEYLSGKL